MHVEQISDSVFCLLPETAVRWRISAAVHSLIPVPVSQFPGSSAADDVCFQWLLEPKDHAVQCPGLSHWLPAAAVTDRTDTSEPVAEATAGCV